MQEFFQLNKSVYPEFMVIKSSSIDETVLQKESSSID